MKLSLVLAVFISSVIVDAEQSNAGYRRRHLTTFQEVCFPTAAPAPAPAMAPVTAPITPPVTSPVAAPVPKPYRGKGGTVVSGPTTESGPVYSPGSNPTRKQNPPSTVYTPPSPPRNSPPGKSGTVYTPPSPPRSSTTKSGTVYTPPSPPRGSSTKSGTVYTPPSPPRGSSTKSGTVYTPPSPPRGSSTKSGTVYSPPSPPRSSSSTKSGTVYSPPSRQLAQPTLAQRALQVISLNTTFAPFPGFSLPAGFSASAVLTWPNLCFFASLSISNFIANCDGCSFVVADGSSNCDPANLQTLTPFVDPTEITYNPYTNSTFFRTDSNGNAAVSVTNLCTGTGPADNVERPLLLLDPNGAIAACGVLSYVCP